MFYGPASAGMSSLNDANRRLFRYEVVGLRQNDQTDRRAFPIRRSGSVFITVPYNRMNEEMRRITRLGGKLSRSKRSTAASPSDSCRSPGPTPVAGPQSALLRGLVARTIPGEGSSASSAGGPAG